MNEFEIYVHERIHARHPEITEDDVRSAFRNMIRCKKRPSGSTVGIGCDSNSRLLELVYQEDWLDDFVMIYHAQTPPTKKVKKELDFTKGKGLING